MKLSVCVQHHPSRSHLLPLAGLGAHDVVEDPDPRGEPSALRTYLECLRRTPVDATHRLVVQDDALPCDHFRERAEAAIAERPDALVALFVPGRGAFLAALRRSEGPWRLLNGTLPFVPTVALSWPAERVAEYVAFAQERYMEHAVREFRRGDDYPVYKWARQEGVEVWAPIPSLVEHPDVTPSLMPDRTAAGGLNKGRVAAAFDVA